MIQSLYTRQRQLNLDIELNPEKFKDVIGQYNPVLLISWSMSFHLLIDLSIPTCNLVDAKKSLIEFRYLLVGLENKFNNSLDSIRNWSLSVFMQSVSM